MSVRPHVALRQCVRSNILPCSPCSDMHGVLPAGGAGAEPQLSPIAEARLITQHLQAGDHAAAHATAAAHTPKPPPSAPAAPVGRGRSAPPPALAALAEAADIDPASDFLNKVGARWGLGGSVPMQAGAARAFNGATECELCSCPCAGCAGLSVPVCGLVQGR